MIESNITNLYTEIYVGGGNWLTESFPTFFHTFARRKILAATDSADNYREVTDAEKRGLEESDAAYVRPPQWVIDMFNDDPHGRFNESTGYFELNGLTDITPRQAQDIAYYGHVTLTAGSCYVHGMYCETPLIRTNLTPINAANITMPYVSFLCNDQSKLEVFRISETNPYYNAGNIQFNGGSCMFSRCHKLRSIIGGNIKWGTGYYELFFMQCWSLEDVRIENSNKNLRLPDCGKLSYESVRFLIDNARTKTTDANTIQVHADIYAKLTDETNAQWHQIMLDAADKNIQFITN